MQHRGLLLHVPRLSLDPTRAHTRHLRTVQYFTDTAVLTPATDHPPTIILGPGERAT